MELTMSTIVIQDLYNNPKSEFSLTTSQVSWYGKNVHTYCFNFHFNILISVVIAQRLDLL